MNGANGDWEGNVKQNKTKQNAYLKVRAITIRHGGRDR